MKSLRLLALLPLVTFLSGCDAPVLFPTGDVAARERDLILASTGLMLLIILPVMAATLIFAWRYRATNTAAPYDEDWDHSTMLEVLIWTAPLLIIIALGALTWYSTHLLDPFRSIERVDANRPVARELRPVTVEVVALDWKWLFIYPEQGIASVNELAAPIDVPINFKLTSADVMNSFFVPTLAGQIYAMPGMETKLHAVANKVGTFRGTAAQYSGPGFSHMQFAFKALSPKDFDAWVANAKKQPAGLDRATYLDLEQPSEANPVHYYSSVDPGLYDAVLNLCAQPGKMCVNEMMHIDMMGGGGENSEANKERLLYDTHRIKEGSEAPGATFPASGRAPNSNDAQPQGMNSDALTPEVNQKKTQPDQGQGFDMPGAKSSPAPAQLEKN